MLNAMSERMKTAPIYELEKLGRRWRRDVSNLSGWWCVKINYGTFALWCRGDGEWVEPDGETLLYPNKADAEECAKVYGVSAEVIEATKAFNNK